MSNAWRGKHRCAQGSRATISWAASVLSSFIRYYSFSHSQISSHVAGIQCLVERFARVWLVPVMWRSVSKWCFTISFNCWPASSGLSTRVCFLWDEKFRPLRNTNWWDLLLLQHAVIVLSSTAFKSLCSGLPWMDSTACLCLGSNTGHSCCRTRIIKLWSNQNV